MTRAMFTIGGKPVSVHALQTGTVTVKKAHACCVLPEFTPYPVRFASIVLDPRFAKTMPIWTYVIDHPTAGLICVDAGATPTYNDIDAWPSSERRRYNFAQSFLKLDVDDTSTLHARLRQAGYDPAQVRSLLLTHQHIDHVLDIPSFPHADIWTTRAEDDAAPYIGAMPFLWRSEATKIRYIDAEGEAHHDVPGLGNVVDLSGDGRLMAFHTPGHTPGSTSLRLRTDQGDLWFTGDTSFTAESMDPKQNTAGIHTSMPQVRALQKTFQCLRGVLLPSHDWTVPERLREAGMKTDVVAE